MTPAALLGVVLLVLSVPSSRAESPRDADPASAPRPYVLAPERFRETIAAFNREDRELYPQYVPNAAAWDFLKRNIPLVDCPDPEIQEIYYFRWWTFRKHLKQTPDGFVITEFLPAVPWAGKHNTISCAAGHHFHEGRWWRDPAYLDDYARFWFRKGGEPRRYSFWAAESLWARYQVTGDDRVMKELLPDLIQNFEAWEKTRRDSNGLYWQNDGEDGMEVSIGGTGYRATINSYQYGDAVAIAHIADLSGQSDIAERFRRESRRIKQLVQDRLWDASAGFFKVGERPDTDAARSAASPRLADAREEHGYTPWYFNLPDADKSAAWKQLLDPKGFYAPFGPTTAEQRHPKFQIAYQGHECQWNGPSWPYATAVTLSALANLLNDYEQDAMTPADYFQALKIYTRAQHRQLAPGRVVPWIDENLNPITGDWISRTLLEQRGSQIPERGKDYNHSSYCDLIISGLLGLRPRADNTIEVNPLAPPTWDYFCLDQVRYHGRWLTVVWDKTGERYGKGKGLRLFADGQEIAGSASLTRLKADLPPREGRSQPPAAR